LQGGLHRFRLEAGQREELTVSIDRSEVSRALAKAIAYKDCGKDEAAEAWAITLVELLGCAGILKPAGWARIADQLNEF